MPAQHRGSIVTLVPLTARVIAISIVASSHANATPPPDVSPSLFSTGNLRVALHCADGFVTADRGMRVSLDGVLIEPIGTNYESYTWVDNNGITNSGSAPTDVGFLVAPGRHHLRVEAADCAADDRDVELSGVYPELVSGRLAIANPDLRGATGAPDGFAMALGGFSHAYPHSLRTGMEDADAYAIDPASTQGVWMSFGAERRHFALWVDNTWGTGTLTGTIRNTRFTGRNLESGLGLRMGIRLPLGDFAFAAGAGLAGSIDILNSAHVDGGFDGPLPPTGIGAAWWVPLWAAATIKPSCNWGVQIAATYDLQPFEASGGAPGLLAGLEWQPNSACSEAPRVVVRP